ncbi:hypothetical protein HMPREF1989_01662 [Porphyromonas gingivalis F0566]|nr:hypothetical protein HMPREF1989_01662 [Porphyromonas gingivalis F0566]
MIIASCKGNTFFAFHKADSLDFFVLEIYFFLDFARWLFMLLCDTTLCRSESLPVLCAESLIFYIIVP